MNATRTALVGLGCLLLGPSCNGGEAADGDVAANQMEPGSGPGVDTPELNPRGESPSVVAMDGAVTAPGPAAVSTDDAAGSEVAGGEVAGSDGPVGNAGATGAGGPAPAAQTPGAQPAAESTGESPQASGSGGGPGAVATGAGGRAQLNDAGAGGGSDDPGSDPPAPNPPGPTAPRFDGPTLITSEPGDYWKEASWVEPDAGQMPEVVVDDSVTYQSWWGFGGAFTEQGGWRLASLDPAERTRAMELLFDPTQGIGLTLGRVPIGADGYALQRYSLDETPDDFTMEDFSIENDRQYLLPYIQAALAVAPDLQLWGVPWTPPPWMKQNDDFDGGEIIDSSAILSAYALYLARFVEAYQDEGVSITSLHLQADIGVEEALPSCAWQPAVLLRFVRDYLGPTLIARGSGAYLWLGTFLSSDVTQYVEPILADPVAADYVQGFGLQWAAYDSAQALADYGLPIQHTEHSPGNFPFQLEGFNETMAPNDYAYAVESWEEIREWIEAGVNSYHAWNLLLDPVGYDLNVERPWPKNALLVVDADGGLITTPAYYVFRHLGAFIEPGATRVNVTGSFESLAFENPDGSVAVVLFNPDAETRSTTVSVKGALLEFSVPAGGWASLHWE